MTHEDRSGAGEIDALFEAYLSARLAGEELEWSAFREAHPAHRESLDERFRDYQRGQALLDRVGLAPEPEPGPGAAPAGPELDAVLAGVAAPRDAASFRLLGPIAQGGMAMIERVWDARLQRPLARKVLPVDVRRALSPAERRRVARFLDEALIVGRMQHPGILPVYEVGIDGHGRPFFTMPIVRGHDLAAVIGKVAAGTEGWSGPRALQVVVSVCETVAYAHSKGVVHRDLKPENVMVGRFGETFVMDWGLAKVMARTPGGAELDAGPGPAVSLELESLRRELGDEAGGRPLVTLDGEVVGTPAFMAPEQAAGEVASIEPQADQYAIGAILYQLMSGRRPYDDQSSSGSAEERIRLVRERPPTPLARLAPRAAPELAAIVAKAMERSPLARYADVAALAADLKAFLEQRVVAAYPAGQFASLGKWIARNRALGAALLAFIVLLVGGFAALSWINAAHGRRLAASNRELADTKGLLERRVEELRHAVYLDDLGFAQRSLATGEDGGQAQLVLDACDADLRGWEWHYLRRLADTSERSLPLSGISEGMAVTRDGGLIATVPDDYEIVVTETSAGRELRRVRCRGFVDTLDFSTDGRWLASWSRDQVLRILEVESGELREFPAPSWLRGFAFFDPSGRQVIVRRSASSAVVIDAATGDTVATLSGQATDLQIADWSFGDHIVFGDKSGEVHVWDARSWSHDRTLKVADRPIVALRVLDDGRRILAASASGRICTFERTSGAELWARMLDPLLETPCGAFDAAGRWFARARGLAIEVTDLESGRTSLRHGHRAAVAGVGSHSAGRLWSMSPRESARLWDVEGGDCRRVLARCGAQISDVSVAPDGGSVVAAAGRRVFRVPLGGGESQSTDPGLGPVGRVRYDPKGRSLAAVGQTRRLVFLDPDGLEILQSLNVEVDRAQALAWAPDGTRVLTAADRHAWRNAALWDPAPGGGGEMFQVPYQPIDGAFAPDGSRFALAGADGCLHIYERETRKARHHVAVSDMALHAVAWSPDGSLLAAGGYTEDRLYAISLIDPERGEIVGALAGHRFACWALRFTPDGRLVSAAGDRRIRVWDVRRQRVLLILELEDGDEPRRLDVSPDGRILAAGTPQGAVYVWSLR